MSEQVKTGVTADTPAAEKSSEGELYTSDKFADASELLIGLSDTYKEGLIERGFDNAEDEPAEEEPVTEEQPETQEAPEEEPKNEDSESEETSEGEDAPEESDLNEDDKVKGNKVPYERFKKVIDEKNELRSEIEALKAKMDSIEKKTEVNEESVEEGDYDEEIYNSIKNKLTKEQNALLKRLEQLETKLTDKERIIVELQEKDHKRESEIAQTYLRKEIEVLKGETEKVPFEFNGKRYVFDPYKDKAQAKVIDSILEKNAEMSLKEAFQFAVVTGKMKAVDKVPDKQIIVKKAIAAKEAKKTSVDSVPRGLMNSAFFNAQEAGRIALARLKREGKI